MSKMFQIGPKRWINLDNVLLVEEVHHGPGAVSMQYDPHVRVLFAGGNQMVYLPPEIKFDVILEEMSKNELGVHNIYNQAKDKIE